MSTQRMVYIKIVKQPKPGDSLTIRNEFIFVKKSTGAKNEILIGRTTAETSKNLRLAIDGVSQIINTDLQAISIRQPWAWLIVNGYKDIENRSRVTHKRGTFLVHASQGMTRIEYFDCKRFVEEAYCGTNKRYEFPKMEQLKRGGIIGKVDIVGCTQENKSEWFVGPYGWVLANAKPLEFRPCKGSLSFFVPKYL